MMGFLFWDGDVVNDLPREQTVRNEQRGVDHLERGVFRLDEITRKNTQ